MSSDAPGRRPRRAPSRPRPIRDPSGFTLVELLIALVVGVVAVFGGLSMLDAVRTSGRTERLRVELQQNARYALDMIERDLQQAGQGLDPNTGFGTVAVRDGGVGGTDTLYILYAEPETPEHTVLAPGAGNEKSAIRLKATCGDPVDDLAAGDFVYVAQGSARGVARVEQVARDVTSRSCGPGDGGAVLGEVTLAVSAVDAEGHGWVFEGNRNGAVLVGVRAAVYFVDAADPAHPRLVRSSRLVDDGSGWDPTPIADMVTDFQVRLTFADGTRAPEADPGDANPENDYEDIDAAYVSFDALARRTDKDLAGGGLYRRTYSIAVVPRNQLYTRNLR